MKQRDIFWFWLPLCASWLLMTAEGPIISATVSRLPNAVVMLAAQGVVIGLSVFIESPIINLLATATALVRDKRTYRLVRRFTIHWMIVLTAVTFLVGFTPFFDVVVRDWLDTPDEVARWVRPGMQIMLLWSAAIAWRRFLQGVLIRFGHARTMAQGTAVRLVCMTTAVVGLGVFTDMPGVYVAGWGWMTGVLSEAAFATWVIRPVLENDIPEHDPHREPIDYADLFWFHLPLAGTAVMVLFVQPLVAAALARLDNPTQSLAAWPIVYQLMLILRAPGLSLPEAVIALSDGGPKTEAPLRRFSLTLAGGMLLFTAVFVFTPLADFYLNSVQQLQGLVAELAQSAMVWFLLFPMLWVLNSWLRGLLIHHKATPAVNGGMVINLLVTAVILGGGVWLRLPGLVLAAVALNAAALVETGYLAYRANRVLTFGLGLLRFGSASAPTGKSHD